MFWIKPLTIRGEASAGDNNDTQVAWMRVAGEVVSGVQVAEARKTFAIHLDSISRSLAGYHAIDYRLPDGSRLRIVSNSGIHHAVLWPAAPEPGEKLPHGFLVVSNWASPAIFKRSTSPVAWKVDPTPVPQAIKPIEADNQVFRALTASAYVNQPMVLTDATPRVLWDYSKRSVPAALTSSRPVVPMNMPVGSTYKPAMVHYGIDNVVYDKDGTSLYTMALSPAILLVDPESPVHAVPNTTSDGSALALQHMRSAIVSPSTGVYLARFANERLVRDTETTYTLQARSVNTVSGPIGATSAPSGSSSAALGETVTGNIFLKYGTIGPGGVGGSSGPFTFITQFRSEEVHDLTPNTTTTQTAFRESGSLTGAASSAANILLAAGATAAEYAALTTASNATGSVLWRGGFIEGGTAWPGGLSDYNWSAWYGVWSYRKNRIDTEYSLSMTPEIALDFPWASIKLFSGSATANCTGGTHSDTRTYGRSQSQWDGNYLARTYIFAGSPETNYTLPPWNSDLAAWEADVGLPLTIKPAIIAMLADYPPTLGGPGTIETTPLKDVRPVNTGSYDYTSRYYIDFDHRGQFYAAIKVRVTCVGAEWRENRAIWDGFMVKHADPTYSIEIALETRWKDIVNSTVLVTVSSMRPPFEFETVQKQNPYYFLFPLLVDRQIMSLRVPPNFGLPIEALSQMMTLCGHQGASTAFACEDIRPDIAPALDAATRSSEGIEFSTWDGRVITPHRKYVTGQLFARTFKLSDFPDALWLLTSTKCDARVSDGATGPAYFYFPTLLNIITNSVFHVEVRDGVHEAWSDEFRPSDSQPAPAARDIKLYRV